MTEGAKESPLDITNKTFHYMGKLSYIKCASIYLVLPGSYG